MICCIQLAFIVFLWTFVFDYPIVSHCSKFEFVFQKCYELEVIYILFLSWLMVLLPAKNRHAKKCYNNIQNNYVNDYWYKQRVYLWLLSLRVVNLLQNGAVMNKVFQPHEAHIPYLLQVNRPLHHHLAWAVLWEFLTTFHLNCLSCQNGHIYIHQEFGKILSFWHLVFCVFVCTLVNLFGVLAKECLHEEAYSFILWTPFDNY